MKLVDQSSMEWQNRSQFFGIAENLMRRILIDHARTKKRKQRGGENRNLPLEEAINVSNKEKSIDLLALDAAFLIFNFF